MARLNLLTAAASLCLLSISLPTSAQGRVVPGHEHVYTPESSLPQPRNAEGQMMARTHLRLVVPSAKQMNFGSVAVQPRELPPYAGYLYETPASLACVYKLVEKAVPGCNPNVTTANPAGGSRAIAIVDAYDDPKAEADLATFSSQFGLPTANFSVVYASGSEPGTDPTGSWEIEESLDIEWAHGMAPEAQIYLVEAADNSYVNLFAAVAKASSLVAAAGGGEVSMSWGGAEFSGETAFDSALTTTKVVYLASAGDSPGVEYPSASPNVISAGGTSISRSLTTGNFVIESAWQEAGGGPSQVEPRPAFQNNVKFRVGSARGTPDLSFDSNPTSGVWVYDSNPVPEAGWYVVGGTSVASPSLAGILNAANAFHSNTAAEGFTLYSDNPSDFNDIYYGNCGLYVDNFADFGYDFCTGLGTPRTLKGK